MKRMQNTIDVIVELPKYINGDEAEFWKWVDEMRDKYGSDQVINMNAEDADRIKDTKLKSLFTTLDKALRGLKYCFAEPEPQMEFVKAYNTLAKVVDNVLAAIAKIKPISEEAKIKFDPAAEKVLQYINNELRAGAVLQKAGGNDYIVFRKAWTFPAKDLPVYTQAILTDYPNSLMGPNSAVPGVLSIKLIK
jgi:hypothetical protein